MSTVADQILEVSRALADNLGVAGEALLPILIKQSYVEGVQLLLSGAFKIFLTVCLIKTTKKLWNKTNSSEVYDEDFVFWCLLGAFSSMVLASLFGISAVNNIIESIGALINPEWYVIEQILDKAL